MEVEHRVLPVQNGAGVLAHLIPQGLQPLFDLVVGHRLLLEPVPGRLEVGARGFQQLEGVGVTGRRLQGVFGDLLRDHAQFRGFGNVFLRLVRGGGRQQEVGQR